MSMNTINNLTSEFEATLAKFSPVKGELYKWRVETNAGPLEIDFMHGVSHEPWIACRFINVEKAKARFQFDNRLNTYSGKWNWNAYEFSFKLLSGKKITDEEAYIVGKAMISAFCKSIESLRG